MCFHDGLRRGKIVRPCLRNDWIELVSLTTLIPETVFNIIAHIDIKIGTPSGIDNGTKVLFYCYWRNYWRPFLQLFHWAGYKDGVSYCTPFRLLEDLKEKLHEVLRDTPRLVVGLPWYQGEYIVLLEQGCLDIADSNEYIGVYFPGNNPTRVFLQW